MDKDKSKRANPSPHEASGVEISIQQIHAEYGLKYARDVRATDTGYLSLFCLKPNRHDLPTFSARWDSAANTVDIDLLGDANESSLFKSNDAEAAGYTGHHSAMLGPSAYLVDIRRPPTGTIFVGEIRLDVSLIFQRHETLQGEVGEIKDDLTISIVCPDCGPVKAALPDPTGLVYCSKCGTDVRRSFQRGLMNIKKVGVLGCGLMGSGIAQVCATAGFDVTVLEVEQKYLDKGFAGIEKSLAKFAERPVEKGGITPQQKDAIRARLRGTTNKAELADCDIVIEAIIENVDEKKKMYASIDGVVKKDAIFASNTSSISVTELLTSVKRPERFIGLHFFNPVPLMKLVEVVRTIATAPEVYEAAYLFAQRLGKVPVRTSDKTGFIVNRLLVPYLLDAIRAYEEGVGSIEDIDNAMKLGCGYPMGPFTLLDFVGLDTTYYITHVMYDEFKERRFASPPLLKRMVMAGWYGRKSGRGFYDYSDAAKPVAGKF
jgi:3-hydroxybutyryl-CoA dehydrogenase